MSLYRSARLLTSWFRDFSLKMSLLGANDSLWWLICRSGARLAVFTQGTTMNRYILNIETKGLMVLENIFKKCFPCISLWKLMDPGAGQSGAKFAGFK